MCRPCPPLRLALLGLGFAALAAASDGAEDVQVKWAPPPRRLGGAAPDPAGLPETLDVAFEADGAAFQLRLQRNRALLPHGARHLLQHGSGRVEEGPMPPPCFYVGDVVGDAAGTAGVSTCGGGISGLVIGHGRALTLEPSAGAPRGLAMTSPGSMRHAARRISDAKFLEHAGDVARFARGLGARINATPPERRLSGSATKYVEVYVVNDNSRFKAFGGQSGLSALAAHSVGVMNSVTAIYRKAPTNGATFPYTVQVVMTGQQTFLQSDPWEGTVVMSGAETDCSSLLDHFNEWGRTQQQASQSAGKSYDNRVLLSGRDFDGNTVGLAGMSVMCYAPDSGNVNMCGATAGDAAHCAATVAHEMGHNFGMSHDSTGNACPQSGLIMEAVGGNEASSQFSSCSAKYLQSFFDATYAKNGECLENSPTHVVGDPICGNGFVEDGEDCDCGGSDCSGSDACCNGATCKFADASYECSASAGPCCESCKFVKSSAKKVCRAARNTCDLPEVCPGGTAECAADTFAYPGKPCEASGYKGLCSGGRCQSLNVTCGIDINRDFDGNWDLSEPCAKFNDGCQQVVCHEKDQASAYECGQAFAVHNKQMPVPSGTPCWFPGSQVGTRTGMCSGGRCQMPHALAEAPVCGNGGIDFGEQCDCGAAETNPCCDCATCQLKAGKQCAAEEPCCNDQCEFAAKDTVCRAAAGGCDIAEVCSGTSGVCPSDTGKKWGTACAASDGKPSTCYGKVCMSSLSAQCAATTSGGSPVGGREPDGTTPDKGGSCQSLMCCTSCATESGEWNINGKSYTDPFLCDGCGTMTSWKEFTVAGVTNRLYLGAAEDGTVLSDPTKLCIGAKAVAPPTSCDSGSFLEISVGRCLPCDASCTSCTGPSNFDCTGGCKYGRDSRGACAISAQQVSFATSSGSATISTPPPTTSAAPGAAPPTTSAAPGADPSVAPGANSDAAASTSTVASSGTAGAGASTSPPPTSTAAAKPAVVFTMTVQSVSYADLVKEQSLLASFVAALKDVIAKAVGVAASAVEVVLSPGSVSVESMITPPESGSVTLESITDTLQNASATDALRSPVVSEISALPNISSVSTGTIAVSEISAVRVADPSRVTVSTSGGGRLRPAAVAAAAAALLAALGLA